MYSHLVGWQCLGNHPNKLVLLDPLWNHNLLLLIKPVKKPSGFEISWKIFLIGLNQCPLYVYIVIVKRQLEGQGMSCITVSLDTYIEDMTQ